MSVRKIVKIDEEKCNGCGLCVPNCVEGALKIIDGKARLVSDVYCDGLGACLGHCPQDAITIEERDAPDFDVDAAIDHMKAEGIEIPEELKAHQAHNAPAHSASHAGGGCPGSRTMEIKKDAPKPSGEPLPCGCPSTVAKQLEREKKPQVEATGELQSELMNWPVQIKLVNPAAPYFQNANLLLAADCAPFAYADFHRKLIQGRPVIIGCPKLDDVALYVQKVAEIIKVGNVKSVTVVHMEVPCCSGLVKIAEAAVAMSGRNIPMRDITIKVTGEAFDNFGTRI